MRQPYGDFIQRVGPIAETISPTRGRAALPRSYCYPDLVGPRELLPSLASSNVTHAASRWSRVVSFSGAWSISRARVYSHHARIWVSTGLCPSTSLCLVILSWFDEVKGSTGCPKGPDMPSKPIFTSYLACQHHRLRYYAIPPRYGPEWWGENTIVGSLNLLLSHKADH